MPVSLNLYRSSSDVIFLIKVPEAFQNLIDNVEKTLKHAIEVEEGIPIDLVTNFDEVRHTGQLHKRVCLGVR